MMRKGIFAAVIVNACLAVSILTYSMVAIFGGTANTKKKSDKNEPTNTTVSVVLRVDDNYSFQKGELTFTDLEEGDNAEIIKNEDGSYKAKKQGSFKAVVVEENKNKTTYNVEVFGYGNGSSETPYNICKVNHLFNLDGNGKSIYDQGMRAKSVYYRLQSDIDLSSIENWKPIGTRRPSFNKQLTYTAGSFEVVGLDAYNSLAEDAWFSANFDGNGYAIKNMKIRVSATNFTQYVEVAVDPISISGGSGTEVGLVYSELNLGFFGFTNGANIYGVSFESSNISVDENILANTFTFGFEASIFGEGVVWPDNYKMQNVHLKVYDDSTAVNTADSVYSSFSANVGTVAGFLKNTKLNEEEADTIKINNSNIRAFSFVSSKYDNGVGGAIGYSLNSIINRIEISNSLITANGKESSVAGLVGSVGQERVAIFNTSATTDFEGYIYYKTSSEAFNNIIANCKLNNVSVVGERTQYSKIAGISVFVLGAQIENVTATGVNISVASGVDRNSKSISAGFFSVKSISTYDYDKTAKTVTGDVTVIDSIVKKVSISANISVTQDDDVAGIMIYNYGATVEDCSFSGKTNGTARSVAGLVFDNQGTINYSPDFTGKAVDVEYSFIFSAAGLVLKNNDGIIASINNDNVQVVSKLNRVSIVSPANFVISANANINDPTPENLADAANMSVVAGLIGTSAGENSSISGFVVDTTITNPINAAGVVGFAGGSVKDGSVKYSKSMKAYDASGLTTANISITIPESSSLVLDKTFADTIISGTDISDVSATITIATTTTIGYDSTNRVAGGFAFIASNVSIDNVQVFGTINKAELEKSNAKFAAGFVAEISGKSISISGSKASVGIFVGRSGHFTDTTKQLAIVAGFASYINQVATDVDAEVITITSCVVNENELMKKIVNRLINIENEFNDDYTVSESSCVAGFVGRIANTGVSKVKINQCSVVGNSLSIESTTQIAGFAFSIQKTAFTEDSVSVKVLMGNVVGGFAGLLNVCTASKVSTIAETITLIGEAPIYAGFAREIAGTTTGIENALIVVLDAVSSTDENAKLAKVAFVNATSTASTFTNVVAFLSVKNNNELETSAYGIIGSSSINNTNSKVFVLYESTLATDLNVGVSYVTIEEMKTESTMISETNLPSAIWELTNDMYPTLKSE